MLPKRVLICVHHRQSSNEAFLLKPGYQQARSTLGGFRITIRHLKTYTTERTVHVLGDTISRATHSLIGLEASHTKVVSIEFIPGILDGYYSDSPFGLFYRAL